MKHLKQEFDKLTFKETLIYSLAIVSMIGGFVLLFLGMYLPPTGEIHDSVLMAFGLILVFCGSLLGIEMHYANQLNQFKSKVIDAITAHKESEKEENKEA